jgi:hypothetical protein
MRSAAGDETAEDEGKKQMWREFVDELEKIVKRPLSDKEIAAIARIVLGGNLPKDLRKRKRILRRAREQARLVDLGLMAKKRRRAGEQEGKAVLSDFISEDDLNTFEGYLRFQAVDPETATPNEVAMFRQFFDEATAARAATPKIGAMKFKAIPGEFRYAVAVRHGSDLWLAIWVRRGPKGDVYVLIPRSDPIWDPHTSYHRDGTFHSKSFNHKMSSSKKQPLTDAFSGSEHMSMFGGYNPKSIGAVCDPAMFSGVVEVPPGILGPRDGFVSVDLVEPGCDPLDLYNPVVITQVFKDKVPWIVIRVGRQASPAEFEAIVKAKAKA